MTNMSKAVVFWLLSFEFNLKGIDRSRLNDNDVERLR